MVNFVNITLAGVSFGRQAGNLTSVQLTNVYVKGSINRLSKFQRLNLIKVLCGVLKIKKAACVILCVICHSQPSTAICCQLFMMHGNYTKHYYKVGILHQELFLIW